MMVDSLWSQQGFFVGDFSVGIIATVCACWAYIDIAMYSCDKDGTRLRCIAGYVARWMMALGWTIISIRIWYALVIFGDAPIAAISILALSLIGSGWIVLNLVRSS